MYDRTFMVRLLIILHTIIVKQNHIKVLTIMYLTQNCSFVLNNDDIYS